MTLTQGYLLPDELADALLAAIDETANATTVEELNQATGRLSRVLNPYLPNLPKNKRG